MEQVRTVLIGFGWMGQQYVEMIRGGEAEGLVLTGICCRNAKGQELIRRKYEDVKIYESVEDTFSHSDEFDAVIVVTPHDTHAAIARRALAAGKHVLSDKPAGVTTREVRAVLTEAEKSQKAYAMMFNNRVKEPFVKAKEMIESGSLGKVTRVVWVCNNWFRTTVYHHSSPWRSTWKGEHGGLLINQCQHNLDIWQWLFGMPDKVYAGMEYGKYNDFQVDDGADIQFVYENGMHGTFISATGENPGVNRLEIWGTKGRLCIEDNETLTFDENSMPTDEFSRVNTEVYGKLAHQAREVPVGEGTTGYALLLQNFADHIIKGTPLYADGQDGFNSLSLSCAAYLSSWQGKQVSLPIDDELFARMLKQKEEEEQA